MTDRDGLERRIRRERRAALIVNTRARRGRRAFEPALYALRERGLEVTGYPATIDGPEGAVRRAIADGHSLIVVGGGDGTVSAVVDELAYRDVALGLLPLGTGNSFARSVAIPLTLEAAADVIAHGSVGAVDLGRIGDDYFANVASIGFLGDVVRRTPAALKRRLGPLAYFAMAAATIWTHRPFWCEIRTGRERFRVRTHQVIIANGSTLGAAAAPELRPDDASLTIVTMDMLNRWQMVPFWVGFMFGNLVWSSRSHSLRTGHAWLETHPPRRVDVDGEPGQRTPCEITLARRALRMTLPAEFLRAPGATQEVTGAEAGAANGGLATRPASVRPGSR